MKTSNATHASAAISKSPSNPNKPSFDDSDLDECWKKDMVYDNLCTSCIYWKQFICTFNKGHCVYEIY